MARRIISDEEWEKAREYFEHGLSLSDIEKRIGISKGALSKKSKSKGWDCESPKKQLLSQAVEVAAAKETLKKHPVSIEVHDELVDEKTRHLLFFKNSALRNQRIANEALEEMEKSPKPQERLYAAATHATTTAKNKETVLGKEASTHVNVQQNNITETKWEVEFKDAD